MVRPPSPARNCWGSDVDTRIAVEEMRKALEEEPEDVREITIGYPAGLFDPDPVNSISKRQGE